MRNVSDKSCRENQYTRFIFNNLFFPPENRDFFKDIVEEYGRARQVTGDKLHAG
jgi:hypothetical protein